MGLALECFETQIDGFGLQFDTGPSAEFVAGRAEGYASGLADAAAQQTAIRTELVQTIADMSFGYVEARLQILGSLEALFRAIIEQIFPKTAEHTFIAHVVDLLVTAAKEDTTVPLELSIHPDQVDAISNAVKGIDSIALNIVPDIGANKNAAWIQTANSETALDIDALIAAMNGALVVLFDETKEETINV